MELKATIKAEIEHRLKANGAFDEVGDSAWEYDQGMIDAYKSILSFLDTLQEPENPIYELNQLLINWIRDGQTDAEKDARWEAYRRFFELHDEAMMQEPNAELETEIKRVVENYNKLVYGSKVMKPSGIEKIARHFYNLGKNAK